VNVTLYWLWPERDRADGYRYDEDLYWSGYRNAAASAGLEFEVVGVDDVAIDAAPDGARVFVRGAPISPEDAFFHAKLYTWPQFTGDVWRYLSTSVALEQAGFWTVVPLAYNVIGNDKLLSYLDVSGLVERWLPTVRVSTRAFTSLGRLLDVSSIRYPVAVKPASWGSGMGVVRADDLEQLDAVLRLASAAELTMVIQPWLESQTVSDVRVYCVDDEPIGALARRGEGALALANVARGSTIELVPVPESLAPVASALARRVDVPYVCLDFLTDGSTFWFSELEVDGAMSARTLRIDGAAEILRARFAAYLRHFERRRAQSTLVTAGKEEA
jgi:hypothetical protein